MRSVKRLLVITLALTLILANRSLPAVRANGLANPNLLALEDHFLNRTLLDNALTTSDIDTALPGTASLHWDPGSVAVRPNKKEMVVCSEGTVRFYSLGGSGMERIPERDIALPGLLSATYSADGSILVLATPTEARAYGIDQSGGLVLLWTAGGLADVVSVEHATGRNFWLLTKAAALYYAWSGGAYQEVSAFRIVGLASARSMSFRNNVVLILDGDTVRYYRFDSGGYVENSAFNAAVTGARAVVLLEGAFRVLSGDGTRTQFYVLGPASSVRVAGMDDLLGGATDIEGSPWRYWEYAALTTAGIVYKAFDGRGWQTNQALSISSPFRVGYRLSDAVVSTVLPALERVARVRAEMIGAIPFGCGVLCEVSTNGGATWTTAGFDVNTDVPNGMSLCYRLTLTTSDPLVTPVVDRIRVLQIGYRVVKGSEVGMGSMKARLVE